MADAGQRGTWLEVPHDLAGPLLQLLRVIVDGFGALLDNGRLMRQIDSER